MDAREFNHVRTRILANAPVLHGAAPRVLHHGYSLLTTQEVSSAGLAYRAALVAYSGPDRDVNAFVLRKSHKKTYLIEAMRDLLEAMEVELGQRLKQTPLGGTLKQTTTRANSTAFTATRVALQSASTPSTPKRSDGSDRVALSEVQANAVSSSASDVVHPLTLTPKKPYSPEADTSSTMKLMPATARRLLKQSQGPRQPVTPVRPLPYSKSVPSFGGVRSKRQLYEKE